MLKIDISVPIGDGGNRSPSGEVHFAIGWKDPKPPSPFEGGRLGWG